MTVMMVNTSSTQMTLNAMPKAGCQPAEGCMERTRRIAKTILMTNKMTTPAATNICAAIASEVLVGCDTDASRTIDVKMRSIQKPNMKMFGRNL